MPDYGFNIYDPDATPPNPAFFWDDANHCWRLPPAPFRWDRFGLHVPAGLAFGLLSLLVGQEFGQVMGAMTHLIFWLAFLAYEITESRAINDKAYPDIAGGLAGDIAWTTAAVGYAYQDTLAAVGVEILRSVGLVL